jgi:hypothetical protein
MLKYLTKLANELDRRGLTKEADYTDRLLIKHAGWADKAREYAGSAIDTADQIASNPMGAIQTAANFYTGGVADSIKQLAEMLENSKSPPPQNYSWSDVAELAMNYGAEKQREALDLIIDAGKRIPVAGAKVKALEKAVDYWAQHGIKGGLQHAQRELNNADDVEIDLTGSAVEEQTASGAEAFRSTLTESDRATLDRLEASEEAEGCRDEHLSSMHDGNAKDSYIEFLNCIHGVDDMSPDMAQDAKQLIDTLANSGVATEEQAED